MKNPKDFVEDDDEYSEEYDRQYYQGREGAQSQDIRETAHFNQNQIASVNNYSSSQLNRINYHGSPIQRFQSAIVDQNDDGSGEENDSFPELAGSINNQVYVSSGQMGNGGSAGYQRVQSQSSSGQAGFDGGSRKISDQADTGNTRFASQQVGKQYSLQSNQSSQTHPQIQKLANLQNLVSQPSLHSQQSQQTQYSQAQQIVRMQSGQDNQRGLINTILRVPSGQAQPTAQQGSLPNIQSQGSQQSGLQNKQSLNSLQSQGSQQSGQSSPNVTGPPPNTPAVYPHTRFVQLQQAQQSQQSPPQGQQSSQSQQIQRQISNKSNGSSQHGQSNKGSLSNSQQLLQSIPIPIEQQHPALQQIHQIQQGQFSQQYQQQPQQQYQQVQQSTQQGQVKQIQSGQQGQSSSQQFQASQQIQPKSPQSPPSQQSGSLSNSQQSPGIQQNQQSDVVKKQSIRSSGSGVQSPQNLQNSFSAQNIQLKQSQNNQINQLAQSLQNPQFVQSSQSVHNNASLQQVGSPKNIQSSVSPVMIRGAPIGSSITASAVSPKGVANTYNRYFGSPGSQELQNNSNISGSQQQSGQAFQQFNSVSNNPVVGSNLPQSQQQIQLQNSNVIRSSIQSSDLRGSVRQNGVVLPQNVLQAQVRTNNQFQSPPILTNMPTSPQFSTQRNSQVIKPQSAVIASSILNQTSQTNLTQQQPVQLRQTIGFSPQQINIQRPSYVNQQILQQTQKPNSSSPPSRSPSPPQNQIFAQTQPVVRQSRFLTNQQSGVQLTGGLRRQSVSPGSNDSRRPRVSFTYHSHQYPVQPLPVQNQVQVIRQHTHSHTVVEKTTTVVWQYRYFTVIEKFNFIYQRFDRFAQQLRIITELLEKAKNREGFQRLYHDLMMRHTLLLDLLSQTQVELNSFREENEQHQKQIQYEGQLRQQALYKDKYKILQQQNAKLKAEIDRLLGELNKSQAHNQKLIDANNRNTQMTNFSRDLEQFQLQIKTLEEELVKSHTINGQLQHYIQKLENDANLMAKQFNNLKNTPSQNNQNTCNQHIELIKNQESIIRQLQTELRNKQNQVNQFNQQISQLKNQLQLQGQANQNQGGQGQGQSNNQQVQHYILFINQLQARIHELEQNDRPDPQYSERKYTEIIQTQRSIIQNIETHFREFTNSANVRQEQLKELLKNQQNMIQIMEAQLKNNQLQSGSGTLDKEKQDLSKSIQSSKSVIRDLQFELRKMVDKSNQLKQQLNSKNLEMVRLKEQYSIEQKGMQDKLEQKLTVIEQQLKNKFAQQQAQQPQNQHQQQQSPRNNINNRQLQQLLQENERLSMELRKKQQQRRKLQQDMIAQLQQLRRKLLQKQSENRLFNDKIAMFDEENKRKLAQKDRRIKMLEEDVESLNTRLKSNISTPRNKYNQQQNWESTSPAPNTQQLRSLKDKISQKQQQLIELQRLKQNSDKKYQSLQSNYNSLDEENAKKNQQLMSLKRQLAGVSTYETQIKTLSDGLNKKNQQILQLKSVAFERNEIKVQLQAIRNQRNTLKTTIKNKDQQIQKLRQSLNQYEAKLRETKLKQSLFPNTNEAVTDELQLMYENVKKKQAQLNKIKQTNQLLETNVQQLEYQLERSKNKNASLQKNFGHQKDQSNQKYKQYQNRIKQLQQKIRGLDQSQKLNKNNFDIQLQNLDNSIKQKEDMIRKLEGENKVLKNKLKNHDSKVQQIDSEREVSINKIRELESQRDNLKKQLQNLENNGKDNTKKLFDDYQIKIVELEANLKSKDNKIKQLQNAMETLKIKASHSNQTEQDFINQQQIQVLRKKLAEYETRLYNQNSSKTVNNYKLRDYESQYVFEQKVIYDLKSQNERLKSLLSGKGLRYSAQQDSPKSKGNVAYIQKRLFDFNQKLEQLIEENRNLEERNTDFASLLGPRNTMNQQLLNSFERQRMGLIRRHRTQISALQARMVDLQRYCSSLESYQSNSIYTQQKLIYNQKVKNVYTEQIAYYKQKNKELEQRIDNHIKLNKQLKQKLEGMLKSGGDPNALQYFKAQVSQLQKQIQSHLAKIKALTQENKKLLKSIQDIKGDNSSESRIGELENKIHELNRRISQLQMQNGILEADLTKYTQQLKNASDQILRYKSTSHQKQQKANTLEHNLREANGKISSYQMQVVKLQNQIKLLQAEIQRLNQGLKSRQGEQSAQISRLKSRINQLQSQLRQYQQSSNTWAESKNAYEQTISMLNLRISNLQNEMGRLNSLYENLIKKARDTQNQFLSLQNKFKVQRNKSAELEALLKKKELQIENMEQFLKRMKGQRDNEGNQSKQRLAYISQMEEAIKSLRSEVSGYKTQIQRLRLQISDYKQRLSSMSSMEEIIKELRLEVQLLKNQNERYKSETQRYKSELQKLRRERQKEQNQSAQSNYQISELQEIIRKLKIEIESYKQQNSRSSAQIERLRVEINRLELQLNKLRSHIQKIQKQMQLNQQIIDGIAYRLQFLRSSYIQIQVLSGEIQVNESNRRQVQILEQVKRSIAGGLKVCSQTFGML